MGSVSGWIRWRRRLVVVAVVAVVLVGLLAVRSRVSPPYSGDEPHYLLVSESLVHDGDVDVKDDYLAGRYRSYYGLHLDPHVNTSLFRRTSPHWYSMHGVGLPAVLVPAFWLDGAHGATVMMVLIAAVVLVLTFLWVRRFTGAWLAALSTATLGLSPFFLGLEGRVFPDLPIAALLLGCLLLLELPRRRPRHLLLLGVLLGVSPWLHFKEAVAFGTIALLAFAQVLRVPRGARERSRQLLALAAPILVSLIGYELSIRIWYASWLPTRMLQPGNAVFKLSEARGLAAVSFDSSHGLLTNNPALLLILAGLPVWLRRYPGPLLRLMLVIAPTILVQATFSDWAGAYAPAGRYALEFIPACVPAIALFLADARVAGRLLAAVLVGAQWMLALAFVVLRPSWAIGGQRSPLLAAIDAHHGPPLDQEMPSFDNYTAFVHGSWQLAAWVMASGLLLCYGAARALRPGLRDAGRMQSS